MKITVDTNILVSATFWQGSSNSIMEKVECGEVELVLSKDILNEFSAVLLYPEIQEKIKNKHLEMNRTIAKVVSVSTIIEPELKLDEIKDDPDDNKILECAVAGGVDFIVSNDKHLLKLKKVQGIPIITSDEFIQMYKTR